MPHLLRAAIGLAGLILRARLLPGENFREPICGERQPGPEGSGIAFVRAGMRASAMMFVADGGGA
jgi:hypothetical protein